MGHNQTSLKPVGRLPMMSESISHGLPYYLLWVLLPNEIGTHLFLNQMKTILIISEYMSAGGNFADQFNENQRKIVG